MTGIAQKNYSRWKAVQEEIFRTLSGARADESEPEAEHKPRQPAKRPQRKTTTEES